MCTQSTFLFLNGKCKKMFNQKKKPAKLAWTTTYRKAHKKVSRVKRGDEGVPSFDKQSFSWCTSRTIRSFVTDAFVYFFFSLHSYTGHRS